MKIGVMIAIGSVSALLAVAIGAFGAHGAATEQAKAWIVTGSQQHMAHSLAMFAAAFAASRGAKRAELAVLFFGVGIILFSGSLYALALGAPRSIAIAAPFGGLMLMAGWGLLAWIGLDISRTVVNEPSQT